MELVTILFVVDGIEKGWKAPDLVFLAVDFAAISVELRFVFTSTDFVLELDRLSRFELWS